MTTKTKTVTTAAIDPVLNVGLDGISAPILDDKKIVEYNTAFRLIGGAVTAQNLFVACKGQDKIQNQWRFVAGLMIDAGVNSEMISADTSSKARREEVINQIESAILLSFDQETVDLIKTDSRVHKLDSRQSAIRKAGKDNLRSKLQIVRKHIKAIEKENAAAEDGKKKALLRERILGALLDIRNMIGNDKKPDIDTVDAAAIIKDAMADIKALEQNGEK